LWPVTAVEVEFVQETLTSPTPAAPLTNVGATGSVAAVKAVDASEHPIALQAFNVKEYSVPDDRPVLLYDVEVAEIEAETRVAPRRSSKRVIGEPPLAGAVQATRTELVVAVFNVMVGASGAVAAATGEAGMVSIERTAAKPAKAEKGLRSKGFTASYCAGTRRLGPERTTNAHREVRERGIRYVR
jgi:hypothetical protein